MDWSGMVWCVGILGTWWDWGTVTGVTFGIPSVDGAWGGVDAGD